MTMAGRMIILIIIIDTFLFFGMGAVSDSGMNYGNYMNNFALMDGSNVNETYGPENLINVNQSGEFVPVDAAQTALSYTAVLNSIFGFIELIFGIASAPFSFLSCPNIATGVGGGICAPVFVRVLIGGTYMVMCIIAVVQLISGRAA